MLLLHSPKIRKINMDMILFLYFMLHVCTLCNFLSQKGHVEFSFFILESVLFLMEVWMTEGPRVNFVIFFIFILYKIVPFCLWNIRFLIHNRTVFRTAAGTARSYVTGTPSWKNGRQNFSYVHRSRKHWKCKHFNLHFKFIRVARACVIKR